MSGIRNIIIKEYRPCVVDGRKALFHCWEEKSDDVDVPSGHLKAMLAIVEFEDGSVSECSPHKVHFCDNKIAEYAFYGDKQNE